MELLEKLQLYPRLVKFNYNNKLYEMLVGKRSIYSNRTVSILVVAKYTSY